MIYLFWSCSSVHWKDPSLRCNEASCLIWKYPVISERFFLIVLLQHRRQLTNINHWIKANNLGSRNTVSHNSLTFLNSFSKIILDIDVGRLCCMRRTRLNSNRGNFLICLRCFWNVYLMKAWLDPTENVGWEFDFCVQMLLPEMTLWWNHYCRLFDACLLRFLRLWTFLFACVDVECVQLFDGFLRYVNYLLKLSEESLDNCVSLLLIRIRISLQIR